MSSSSAEAFRNPSATRQAGGYKATINNPQRSEETKQAAREKLDDLESKMVNDDAFEYDESHDGLTAGKNTGNVLGGYKATLKNPRVSEEAKQNAKQVLVEHDAL